MSPADHTPRAPRRWRRLRRIALALVIVLAIMQVAGWFTSEPQVGHFRSPEDQEAYQAAYQEALATMPEPTRVLDIPTSFGVVRAYEWVNPDAPATPVVLLPGRSSGVPMWSENLPSLLAERTVYALDALGDAGLSAQTAPLESMADQAQWIDETLAGLGISQAHLVGHSFGAANAAAVAVHRPERIATLTLLEPAFVLNWPSASVWGWTMLASLPFIPQSWRDTALARVSGEDVADISGSTEPVAQMINIGSKAYSAALPTPRPLTADELAALPMPVYVALADGSPITGAKSASSAEQIPQVQIKVWPNTTHSLPMQVAEPLATELGEFWSNHE